MTYIGIVMKCTARRRGSLAIALLSAFAAGDAVFAQGASSPPLEKGSAPIDVAVDPNPAALGATVTIRGTSLVLQDLATIKITVRPPQGSEVALQAKLDANGNYATSYAVTAAGAHEVVALAPDGKATATAEFSVMAAAVVSEQSTKAIEQLVADAREGIGQLRQQIAEQQSSPPQAELVERLDQLAGQLQQAPAVKLRQGLVPLDKLVQQHPGALAELQPAYDAVAEAGASAGEMSAELRERLQNVHVNRLCDDIHAAGEALSFVGLAMTATLSPITTLLNVLVQKTLPERVLARVPELAADPAAEFMVSETIKQGYAGAQGYATFAQAQVGLLGDIGQLATESLFREYCEKYEGPMKALFHLEFFEGGERWYAYDVELDGRLQLRYEKGGTGNDIPVRGEFEGSATKFTVWENLIVLEPRFRRYLVARKAYAPVAIPTPIELGQIGGIGASKLGASGIHYFNVPVTGVIRDDQLALKFEDARADYDENAKARVIYIFMEPLLPIPEIYTGEFPYYGAHYILTRATRSEPVFEVGADATTKTSRFTRRFEREEHKPGSYLIRWKLDVQACNPSC